MSAAAAFLGALGGGVVFVGAIVAVARGIFRQVNATEANTRALTELTSRIEGIGGRMADLETRLARLEGRSSAE